MTLTTFKLHKGANSAWYEAYLRVMARNGASAASVMRVLADESTTLIVSKVTQRTTQVPIGRRRARTKSTRLSCIHPEVSGPMIGHCGQWQAVTLPMHCGVCHMVLLALE